MNPTVFVVTAFVFGTIIGSFLNVLIWRLPREEKISGRSHCPKCDHQLCARDLVPVVSYAVARGRCRYCSEPVHFRYPLIEVITGALFALAAYYAFPTDLISGLVLARLLIAIAVCVAVFVIDLEHYLILNKLVYPAAVIFGALDIAYSIIADEPVRIFVFLFSAILAALPFLVIYLVSKGKWMGLGDVRFIFLMGLILGWPGILVALFTSFILGAILGLVLIATGNKNLSSKLAFGTFLSFATIFALFMAPRIWEWYWNLFTI